VKVTIVEATRSDAGRIAELLDDYLGELSSHREVPVGAVDAASYPYLDAYWTEPGRQAFLLANEGRAAGFALIRSPASTGTPAFQMAEFYVAPKSCRMGIGRQAAVTIFRRHLGPWELQVHARNAAAVSFWAASIREVARDPRPPIEIHATDGRRFQFNFDVDKDA